MIIDSHIHLFREERDPYEWSPGLMKVGVADSGRADVFFGIVRV
jgi:predicted TIM-barrel fold metal-dependent hydrolase